MTTGDLMTGKWKRSPKMKAEDLTRGMVGILQQDGRMAGTGFVVHHGMVATCAHVVDLAGAGPDGTVHLTFHTTKGQQEAKVEPEYWRDPEAEDIAILRLEGSLPDGVKPVLIGHSPQENGHPFITFGYPPVREKDGMWGYGTVGNLVPTGAAGFMLQLSTKEVTAGFSGAPILDDDTGRVVGMVSTITPPDRYRRLQETTFVTPTETLKVVCPTLSISPNAEEEEDKPLWDPTASPMSPTGVMGPLGPLGPLGSMSPKRWWGTSG
jgi:hypothetical protein